MNQPGFSDTMQALQLPKRVMDRYGGPVGLVGKFVGLGQDEIEAGIPWWSWCVVGAMVGGAAVYAARNKLERIFSD